MKAIILSFVVCAALAFPSFEEFHQRHHRKYSRHSAEYTLREQLYDERVAQFRAHNKGNATFQLGVNEFADYTDAELKTMRGYKPGRRTPGMPAPVPTKEEVALLPPSVDWRTKNAVTSIKNQGQCGSCWAFGGTASIESALAVSGGPLINLSEQEFVSCTPNPDQCGGLGGCQGATADVLFAWAMKNGVVSDKDYPYTSGGGQNGTCNLAGKKKVVSIGGFYDVKSNNEDALMAAVAQQPVAINVDASQWSFYQGGILSSCTWIIDHVVLIVGYGSENGQNYWIVKNSWGPNWGENGYIRLARTNPGQQPVCGTNTDPSQGVGCAGGPATEYVCGLCGLLYAASYPTGVRVLQ